MSIAWQGDWKARVVQRVQRLGFANTLAFVAAHPNVPFGKLFRLLRESSDASKSPIAIAQFQAVYFEEAANAQKLQDAIADTLVRRLHEHLRSGWNRGKNIRERRASAFSQWELPMFDRHNISQATDRVWRSLIALQPPDDWCPASINDRFIESAFSSGWGIAEQGGQPEPPASRNLDS